VSELRRMRQLEEENRRLKGWSPTSRSTSTCSRRRSEKKAEAGAPPRARRVVPGDLRDQHRARVCAGPLQPGRLVRAEPGEGPDGPAAAHPRPGAGATALRVPADLGAAAAGRLGGEPEARAAAVPPRRAAAPDARAPPQAPGAAPRPGAGALSARPSGGAWTSCTTSSPTGGRSGC
jgi:hypothetical protein